MKIKKAFRLLLFFGFSKTVSYSSYTNVYVYCLFILYVAVYREVEGDPGDVHELLLALLQAHHRRYVSAVLICYFKIITRYKLSGNSFSFHLMMEQYRTSIMREKSTMGVGHY